MASCCDRLQPPAFRACAEAEAYDDGLEYRLLPDEERLSILEQLEAQVCVWHVSDLCGVCGAYLPQRHNNIILTHPPTLNTTPTDRPTDRHSTLR